MRHMILFRISLQKTDISKNMRLLNTAYADCQTTCCMRHHVQKESCSLSKRENMFQNCIVTSDELWCHYHIPTSMHCISRMKRFLLSSCAAHTADGYVWLVASSTIRSVSCPAFFFVRHILVVWSFQT